MPVLKHHQAFSLESGQVLPALDIAYQTYGALNADRDNVIWVAHALTGNAEVAEWWSGLFGAGKVLDPTRHFIVCANMLGSCYGTTGPASINPATQKSYGRDFPLVTVRDMVKAHQILRAHLGIERVLLGIGGSMGGQQLVEWACIEPTFFKKLCLLATNAVHSPWGIAFNEAQRMAIESKAEEAEGKGLEAARAIAMLSYRNYQTYNRTQGEQGVEKLDNFRASSYQRYQGMKLSSRFNVWSYHTLTKAMDSHDIGRRRASSEEVLQGIRSETLVIGVRSDILFPPQEQLFLQAHIPNASIKLIDSPYGHDGFLVETPIIEQLIQTFITNQPKSKSISLWSVGKSAPRVLSTHGLPGTEPF
ncbi:MAG: homoserine O-acetyltransferase [Bacteroidota bacterium]